MSNPLVALIVVALLGMAVGWYFHRWYVNARWRDMTAEEMARFGLLCMDLARSKSRHEWREVAR